MAAMTVIGSVRDRGDNFSPASTGECANCRWRWPTQIQSRAEHRATGFFVWHRNKNRYLCYLCAQSCPDLQEKNPDNWTFKTYEECHKFRSKNMVAPSGQSRKTWDSHYREIWQKPWESSEAFSSAQSSDSKDMLDGICQLQSSVIRLQEELSDLAHKLEDLKNLFVQSPEGQHSSSGLSLFSQNTT